MQELNEEDMPMIFYIRLVKKLILFLLISVGLKAQFNYQAIVKDSDGNPVTNNQVKFKFSLMYQSSTACLLYTSPSPRD